MCAALAIDGLLFDGEAGAQVYSAAADKEQAALVFNVAASMIRADDELESACEILDSQKRIVHRKSGSVYRAISAEAYSKHGFDCSRVIYDSYMPRPHPSCGMCSRRRPARARNPSSLRSRRPAMTGIRFYGSFTSTRARCEEDPTLDPSFLPVLFEAAPEDDWTDERVWHACNPALGDFRSLEDMRIACERAKQISAQENIF